MTEAKYNYDGHTRRVRSEDLVAGNVLRTVACRVPNESGGWDAVSPFSDHVILGVFWTNKRGERAWNNYEREAFKADVQWVLLARPYLFASGTNSCCPSALVGYEKYEAEARRVINEERFCVVLDSLDKPVTMLT